VVTTAKGKRVMSLNIAGKAVEGGVVMWGKSPTESYEGGHGGLEKKGLCF